MLAPPVAAQQWNDEAVRRLVARAAAERSAALGDSSLRSWSARAHGILTFHAEFAGGLPSGPRLIRGDELDVEVYWERPDRSKQVVRAWRDSTFFPTNLAYHRDHLGIVSNDFGDRIRIGDGDEVADVVHPLAPDGPAWYDYRLRDTLRIGTGGHRLVLAGIEVRPRSPTAPGVAGMIHLDLDRAQMVRFRFTFTPAAYRDRDLENLTVMLERSLVEDRYWLPYRQEIEIRRRSATLDFPVRGVIRGRWDIDGYSINPTIPVSGPGSWLGGLRGPGGPPFSGTLISRLDSTLTPVEGSALAEIRTAASRIAGQRLAGRGRLRPGVPRGSEFLRWNRVEGLRLGAGLGGRALGLERVQAAVGVSLHDGRVTGRIDLARAVGRVSLGAEISRQMEDAGDRPAASGAANTLAGLVGGRDLGDYALIDRLAVGVTGEVGRGLVARLAVGREQAASVEARARPISGDSRPNPALGDAGFWVGRLDGRLAGTGSGAGWTADGRAEVGAGSTTWGRIALRADRIWRAGGGEWEVEVATGAATARLPARRAFLLGGVGTLPGRPFREEAGRSLAMARLDRRWSVRGPSVGLGAFGRTAPRMEAGLFAALGRTAGQGSDWPWQAGTGWHPVVGAGLQLFDRAIRVEVGRGLGRGAVTTVAIDVDPRWWPIL